MKVKSICHRPTEHTRPFETVSAAAQRMASRNVGTLLVVDAEGELHGIITDRDLALKVVGAGLDPTETMVRDVMTADLETVNEETSVETALAAMEQHGVRRLPVVSLNGQPVGVLSLDDVLGHEASLLGSLSRLLSRQSPETLLESEG